MEPSTQLPTVDTDQVVKFLIAYRDFEKLAYGLAFDLIRKLFPDQQSLSRHLCDHWYSKRKNFGTFFLNLDDACKKRFLDHWEIRSHWSDMHFMHQIVLFFNNHAISEYSV